MTISNITTPSAPAKMNYSTMRPISRTERAILRIEQAKRAPKPTAQPVVKPAPTPATHPMTATQKANLAAYMAQFQAERSAA